MIIEFSKGDGFMMFKVSPQLTIDNPSSDKLWEMSKEFSLPNNLHLPLFHSKVKSRSAKFTQNYEVSDAEAQKYIKDVQEYLNSHKMIKIDSRVGDGSSCTFKATLFVSEKYPQLAFMFQRNLFEPNGKENDEINVITIPEYPERKIMVFPHEATEIILGSDYYGETKMAALRLAMYLAREKHSHLGLHAGSKAYNLMINGEMKRFGVLIFGLSGTGKTTLTCATHDLKDPESVEIVQDDINFLNSELDAFGSERNFYVKTDSITSQPLLLAAVKEEGSILENVYVSEDGEVDFDNMSVSTNGRAVLPREHIPFHASSYSVGKVNTIFFNTRRDDIPPILKLDSYEQAAAVFGLGESTITSADDPSKVGQPVRTVGFNPFIIEKPAKEINTFKEFLKGKEFQAFVINTGWIGGRNGLKIKPQDTFMFVENALRGKIEFKKDPVVGFEVPVKAEGWDISKFDPMNFYSKEEYEKKMNDLRKERKEALRNIHGVDEDIIESL